MGELNNEVKTINGYFKKQNIAARLGVDTVELIDENFELITGGIQTVTDRKLIECLVDLALSKVKPDVSSQKLIAELKSQNSELTNANNMLLENNKQLHLELEEGSLSPELVNEAEEKANKLNSSLEITLQDNLRLKTENDALRAASGSIPENSVLVNLTTKTIAVILEICKAESERTGSVVTPDLLFKNVLFFVIKNGPHDIFKAPISVERIREISAAINNV